MIFLNKKMFYSKCSDSSSIWLYHRIICSSMVVPFHFFSFLSLFLKTCGMCLLNCDIECTQHIRSFANQHSETNHQKQNKCANEFKSNRTTTTKINEIRHETPVLAHPLKIIHIDNELIVLDKPSSMPVSNLIDRTHSITLNWWAQCLDLCVCVCESHRVMTPFMSIC